MMLCCGGEVKAIGCHYMLCKYDRWRAKAFSNESRIALVEEPWPNAAECKLLFEFFIGIRSDQRDEYVTVVSVVNLKILA